MNLSDEDIRKITDALLNGNKILAIKIHREATGSDLREAKEYIESLIADPRKDYPDKFPETKTTGCAALLVAGVFISVALGVIAFRLIT